jgi:hypothetical protein
MALPSKDNPFTELEMNYLHDSLEMSLALHVILSKLTGLLHVIFRN